MIFGNFVWILVRNLFWLFLVDKWFCFLLLDLLGRIKWFKILFFLFLFLIFRTPKIKISFHKKACNIACNFLFFSLLFATKYEKKISSLQKQVSVMSMNLSAKLDELQRGDRHMETTVALCEIRTQLQELTKSVESCQSEVSEVSLSILCDVRIKSKSI